MFMWQVYLLCMSTFCVWVPTVVYAYLLCISTYCVWVLTVYEYLLCNENLLCMSSYYVMRAYCVWVPIVVYEVYEYLLCMSTYCIWVSTMYEFQLCMSTYYVWVSTVYEYLLWCMRCLPPWSWGRILSMYSWILCSVFCTPKCSFWTN